MARHLTPHELECLCGFRERLVDPFVFLGAHPEDGVVRAFAPKAESLWLLPDGEPNARRAMARIDARGLFELEDPSPPLRYELESLTAGRTERWRDAYTFAPVLGDLDLHLVAEGRDLELWHHLGARLCEHEGVAGATFAVLAPNARRVSVIGDFDRWDALRHPMRRRGPGVWELFVPGATEGALYKFQLLGYGGQVLVKVDPLGRAMELRPSNASRLVARHHAFRDEAWMRARAEGSAEKKPMTIYEAHLGSWRHKKLAPGEAPPPHDTADDADTLPRKWLGYRELAHQLVDYVAELGFTHIELLPVMEHPYDGSWGYQVGGYFAPSSRWGTPDDFRYFVDRCHERGIGVILDWVPAHFPKDAWALGRFDGTALYEHEDPRQGEHKQWGTYIFNYGRPEVANFLVANALYWLDEFHVDGLRCDAVASMLHLDYSAETDADWVPNEFGGNENLHAVDFVRQLTTEVHARHPGALVIAEESTTWPGVTHRTSAGGLGFDFKWNMGWMHDTLEYMKLDPVFRSFHHQKLTFGLMYAFSERFLLPLSHDEVVHLKKSLLSKMSGDRWRMFAGLRALYAHMWAHPGKKLLFMGGEIGEWDEWLEWRELHWQLLDDADHAGVQKLVRDLNTLYRRYEGLWEADNDWAGFQWIDANDNAQSVVSFLRCSTTGRARIEEAQHLDDTPPPRFSRPRHRARPRPELTSTSVAAPPDALALAETDDDAETEPTSVPDASRSAAGTSAAVRSRRAPRPLDNASRYVVCVGNFTPLPRYSYRVGVPFACRHAEVLNTDAAIYGGSGLGNLGSVVTKPVPCHGHAQSLELTLPPLSVLWLVPEGPA